MNYKCSFGCKSPTPGCSGCDVKPLVAANSIQVGGDHYRKYDSDLQPWDVIHKFRLGFFEGVIFKYLVRWRDKNGVEDLKKARHYLDKLIELHEVDEGARLVKRIHEVFDSRGPGC